MAILEQLTGWKAKHPVKAEWISKAELHKFVEKRLASEVKPEEVRIEQLTLRMFGLIPDGFDLRKTTVELVTEQAAAFYDYNRKTLFVLDTEDDPTERRVTLAHELAHALADQRFSLKKYMNGGMSSDDAQTARQAVVEGQATWLMWAFLAAREGKLKGVPAAEVDMATKVAQGSTEQFPVLAGVPMYIRESMMFPYTKGLLFQDDVFKKQGREGFTAVFEHPPATTQQIIHPGIYASAAARLSRKTKDSEMALAPVAQVKSYKLVAEGSVGEFDHHILLNQFVDEKTADDLAPLWRNGGFRLYESKHGKQPLLNYASEWDSAASAARFFTFYRSILKGKWKKLNIEHENETELRGRGDYGLFRVWREGKVIYSMEGLHY